jgi:PAS domain S-box-containing protein
MATTPEVDVGVGEAFHLLVESVQDYAIYMLDPAGRVATWNQGAERIKGYAAHEIVGQHFSVFYPTEDVLAGSPDRGLQRAAKEGRFEAEGWRVRRDGSRFWALATITALRDASGNLTGFAKVTRDLTEQRQREAERLAAEQREAERLRGLAAETAGLEQMKSDLLNLASHELRTPASVIGGYLSMLQDSDLGRLSPAAAHAVSEMRSQADLLTLVIDQMLDAARIRGGTVKLQNGRFDLRRVIGEVTAWARPRLGPGHQLCVARNRHAISVSGDREAVAKALRYLIDNAVKYSPDGGAIAVSVRTRSTTAYLRVSDQGQGITRRQGRQLFRPFGRVVSGRDATIRGAGLGLYLAHNLVRLQGGDLRLARAQPPWRTAFVMRLPLQDP